MNILDENIIDSQRNQLKSWRISVRQIGFEIGRKGIQDEEILSLLHQQNKPTFFTRDDDFFKKQFCHKGYCLVLLNVGRVEVATFSRRVLKHQSFNTKAKRMGKVIRVSHVGLSYWSITNLVEEKIEW